MIRVIATIELAAGRRDAFLKLFHVLVPKVQAEEGCLDYGPLVDVPTNISAQPAVRPNVVTVVEAWESVEALETHLMAPHMLDYRKAAEGLVMRVTLQVLEPA